MTPRSHLTSHSPSTRWRSFAAAAIGLTLLLGASACGGGASESAINDLVAEAADEFGLSETSVSDIDLTGMALTEGRGLLTLAVDGTTLEVAGECELRTGVAIFKAANTNISVDAREGFDPYMSGSVLVVDGDTIIGWKPSFPDGPPDVTLTEKGFIFEGSFVNTVAVQEPTAPGSMTLLCG